MRSVIPVGFGSLSRPIRPHGPWVRIHGPGFSKASAVAGVAEHNREQDETLVRRLYPGDSLTVDPPVREQGLAERGLPAGYPEAVA